MAASASIELIAPSIGTITRAGFAGNVEVCVRYLAAWLDGNGCVPIHHMMEDAATAEIARAQLWQWIHYADDGHAPLHLDDGTAIDEALLDRVLLSLPSTLAGQQIPGASRVPEAIALLEDLLGVDFDDGEQVAALHVAVVTHRLRTGA